ncbi:MAG: hypothetical protein M1298_00665, partial [Chloroflexi bacterium]|nr:hypothetical protein [Chloroflexota bacterium]
MFRNFMRRQFLVVSAAGILLAGGVVIAGHQQVSASMLAQTTTTTSTTQTSTTATRGQSGPLQHVLNQLVSQGTISKAQEATILTSWQQYLRQHPPLHHFGGLHRGGFGFQGLSVIASTLKLTPQQLMTDLHNGQTIAQIAQQQGVALSTVKAAAIDRVKARLDQAVQRGRITQAQENTFLANLNKRLDTLFTSQWPPASHGAASGWH